jgi:hypothetical protein
MQILISLKKWFSIKKQVNKDKDWWERKRDYAKIKGVSNDWLLNHIYNEGKK